MKLVKFFALLSILLGLLLGSLWILEVIPKDLLSQYAMKSFGVLGLLFVASAGLSLVMGKAKPTSTKNGPQF